MLATVVERVRPCRWRAIISVMQRDGRMDKTVPIIDLGIFSSKGAARSAVAMVVESWVWEPVEPPPALADGMPEPVRIGFGRHGAP
jgi:hypothetical protein